MNALLTAIATANPEKYITQQQAYQFLDSHFKLTPRERQLYQRILLNGPINGRYFGIDYEEQFSECTSHDELIKRFLKYGSKISVQAASKAIIKAGLQPADVGGLIVNTCTGYLCPGLSSYIAEQLHLEKHIRIFDLMGMGCGAAIPNIESACRLVPQENKVVLSVSVEICSATFFMDSKPDLIISNSIFGDGASAVIIQKRFSDNQKKVLTFLDFESLIQPEFREHLRYLNIDGRLRNTLSKKVPFIAAKAVAQITKKLLERNDINQNQIDWWIIHPGGSTILEEIEKEMHLPHKALDCSYSIFHDYGNMSSPTVMFVLERLLQQAKPHSHQKGLLLSFGAGFTAFGALVEF